MQFRTLFSPPKKNIASRNYDSEDAGMFGHGIGREAGLAIFVSQKNLFEKIF